MFDISKHEYVLYLCKSDKTKICVINYTDIEVVRTFRQYSELTFEIPNFQNGWMQVEDKTFNLLQPNYLILLESINDDKIIDSEYYIIDQPTLKDDNGVIKKSIHCYSSDHMFVNRYLRSYNEVRKLYDPYNSYDINDNTKGGIVNYMLEQMSGIWQVNYFSESLKDVYHSFDYSSNTYQSVLEDLSTVYNCYFIFDTVNNYINIYTPDEYGEDTGIIISNTDFIKSLSCDIKNSELCTRLRCYGKDNITISSKNITGQYYIDDFSYFMNNGYFSDSLYNAMVAYNTLKSSKEGVFSGYLNQLNTLQESLNTLNNELNDLNTELETIEDTLEVYKENDRRDSSAYRSTRTAYKNKKSEISAKEDEIADIENQIATVNNNITALNNLLSYENNFTTEQLKELSYYIIEGTLKLDSVNDESLLYEYAQQYIKIKSIPPYDFSISLVDLFSIGNKYIENRYDKIKVGNYIVLDSPELGFNCEKFRITKIQHNKLSNSLSITISNKDYLNELVNYLNNIFKKSAEAADTLDTNSESYLNYTNDSDTILYNDSTIDTSTNTILAGSNFINKRGWQGSSLSSSGEIQIKSDKIIFSQDDWDTYYTMLSSEGLYLETSDGLSRFVLTPQYGLQLDLRDSTSDDWVNAIFLGYTNGVPSLHIDNGYISLLKVNNGLEKNLILLDPSVGIKIQKNTSITPGSPVWKDSFYIGTDGDVYLNGKIANTSVTGWFTIEQAGTSNIADFKFYVDSSTTPLFSLYNSVTELDLQSFGITFLTTNGDNCYAQGHWEYNGSEIANNDDLIVLQTNIQNWVSANFVHK